MKRYLVMCADKDIERPEVLYQTNSIEDARADARQRKALGEGKEFVVMMAAWTTKNKGERMGSPTESRKPTYLSAER